MQNAGVKRAVRLRRRRARDRERAFLIEGYRELLRAVEARLPLESVYHCPALYLGSNEPALLDRARRECGAELVATDDTVFAKLSYRDRPDGLLAVAHDAGLAHRWPAGAAGRSAVRGRHRDREAGQPGHAAAHRRRGGRRRADRL